MANESRSPITAEISVGVLGGSSTTTGSGKRIREALEGIMNDVGKMSFDINITPVIAEDALERIQNQIQSEINAKDIKVKVGAEIVGEITQGDIGVAKPSKGKKDSQIGDVSTKRESSSPASKIEKRPEPNKEYNGPAMDKSMGEFWEKQRKSLKAAFLPTIQDIERLIGEIGELGDLGGLKDKTSWMQSYAKKLVKEGEGIKSYYPPESDAFITDSNFITERNLRVNAQSVFAPLKEAVAQLKKSVGAIRVPSEDAGADSYINTLNKYLSAIVSYMHDVDLSYDTHLSDNVEVKSATVPPALKDTVKRSKSTAAVKEKTESETAPLGDTDSVAKALSKIKVGLNKATTDAIKAIGDGVTGIRESVDKISQRLESGTSVKLSGEKDVESVQSGEGGVNNPISPDIVQGLSDALSGISIEPLSAETVGDIAEIKADVSTIKERLNSPDAIVNTGGEKERNIEYAPVTESDILSAHEKGSRFSSTNTKDESDQLKMDVMDARRAAHGVALAMDTIAGVIEGASKRIAEGSKPGDSGATMIPVAQSAIEPGVEIAGNNVVKDYSSVLERIVQSVESFKLQSSSLESVDIKSLVEEFRAMSESNASTPPEANLMLSSDFTYSLIDSIANAVKSGISIATSSGGEIKAAIIEALGNFPDVKVSQESIDVLVSAIGTINIPAPNVTVEPPGVFFGGMDYSSVLGSIDTTLKNIDGHDYTTPVVDAVKNKTIKEPIDYSAKLEQIIKNTLQTPVKDYSAQLSKIEKNSQQKPTKDYSGVLEQIKVNTTAKPDPTDTLIKDIPKKVAEGVTNALNGIGVTKVGSPGTGRSGVGRKLLSPDKALEELFNERVDITRQIEDEKKSQLNRKTTDGKKAASGRKIGDLEKRLEAVNQSLDTYKDNANYNALLKSAQELEENLRQSFNSAKEIFDNQNAAYEELNKQNQELYAAQERAINNADNNKSLNLNGVNKAQAKVNKAKSDIAGQLLSDDTLSAESDSLASQYSENVSALLTEKIDSIVKELYQIQTDIDKAKLSGRGHTEKDKRLVTLRERLGKLSEVASSLGMDSVYNSAASAAESSYGKVYKAFSDDAKARVEKFFQEIEQNLKDKAAAEIESQSKTGDKKISADKKARKAGTAISGSARTDKIYGAAYPELYSESQKRRDQIEKDAQKEKDTIAERQRLYTELERSIIALGETYQKVFEAVESGNDDLRNNALSRQNALTARVQQLKQSIVSGDYTDDKRDKTIASMEHGAENIRTAGEKSLKQRYTDAVNERLGVVSELAKAGENIDQKNVDKAIKKINSLSALIARLSGASSEKNFDTEFDFESRKESALDDLMKRYTELKRERERQAAIQSLSGYGSDEYKNALASVNKLDKSLSSLVYSISSIADNNGQFDEFADKIRNANTAINAEGIAYKDAIRASRELADAQDKLNNTDTINKTQEATDALAELNAKTTEYSNAVNAMRNGGGYDFWNQAFKEDAGVTPGLDKGTEKQLKNLVDRRIKAQKDINKNEIAKIKANPDTEEYASAVRNIENLTARAGELDKAINNLKPLYPDLFKNEASQLAELDVEFQKQKDIATAQVDVYRKLREEVVKLGEAQRSLDLATVTGDEPGATNAREQLGAANANIESYREQIRNSNLTDDKFEHDIADTQNREEFARLAEVTQAYYDNKMKLIRLGVTEDAQMSDEYKRVQSLVNAYKELKDSVRSGINDSEFRSNGRFYNIQNQEDALKKQVTLENNRAKALQTIYKWQTKNSKAADEYKDKLGNIISGLNSSDITEEGINSFKMAYENVVAEATARGIIGRNETEAEMKANSASAKSLMQRYQDLLSKADAKAFKEFGSEINTTKSAIDDAMKFGTNDSLKNARRQLSELTTEFKTAGYAGGNLFTSLDKKIRGIGQLLLSGGVIGQIKQQLTSATDSVINLDSAFANIRMTMSMSNEEMHKLGDQSISLAKELGTSLESITQAATIYANQNITTEEIMNRAKPTALLATAAEMSSSSAADLIQGSMYQFEMEDTVDNLNRVVDVVEKISASTGVEFKRSIEQISEGIQTTGAMAHEAGYSFEQYSALIGGLVEKTRRNGSELANSVKMIFARLGQNKEGDATDEEISQAEKAYKTIGINLRDGTDSFRDLPEVFDELNAKWKTMTDVQKAYIAEISAGNRNRSVFMAMMNGYDSIAKLTDDAKNSAGYAEEANEARMESFDAKYGQLKAAAQGFWNNFTDTDWMKKIIDLATGLVSILDTLINKSTVFSGAVKALMFTFALKALPNFAKELSESDSTIGMVIRSVQKLIPNINSYNKAVSNFAAVDKNNFSSIFDAFKGEGSIETKTRLAKLMGIDDDSIQKAVEAVESGIESVGDIVSQQTSESASEAGSSVDEWADQISDSLNDISGFEVSFDETGLSEMRETVDQINTDGLQDWSDLAEANENIADATENRVVAVTESIVATEQSTAANIGETAALQGNTVATTEQTAAEMQRTAAGTAGAANDVAHAATQATLLQRIKLATAGIRAQAAAWAATPIGMFTIIATAVGAIVGGMDLLKQKSEEAREKIEETFEATTTAVEKYREEMRKLDDSEDKVVELSNKYRRLSKGVSENGYRVSLTREEYQEYKDVVGDIVSLNDALVSGYNSEGLALIDLGETVDETRKKYQELAKEKAKAFLSENKDTVLEANSNTYKYSPEPMVEYDSTVLPQLAKEYKEAMEIDGVGFKPGGAYIEFYNKYEALLGSRTHSKVLDDFAKDLGYSNFVRMKNTVDETGKVPFDEINDLIEQYENDLNETHKNVNAVISAEIQSKDAFYSLDTEQKEFIDAVLETLLENNDFYRAIANDDISGRDFASFLLSIFSNTESNNLTYQKSTIDEQYKTGLITISEYQNKMQDLKDKATEAVGDSDFADIFTEQFNTNVAKKAHDAAVESVKQSTEAILSALGSDLPAEYSKVKYANQIGPVIPTYNDDGTITDPRDEVSRIEHEMNKELVDALDGFTTDDIQIMARLDINPEWDEADLREEIKLEKLRMRDIANSEFNFLDSGYKSDIEKFTTNISKLKTAMQSVETMTSDDLLELMMTFNTFDWASFGVTGEEGVGNVRSAIKALADKSLSDLKDTFGDVDSEQIKVFTSMADDAKKAATKINDLADAMSGLSSMYSTLKTVQEEMAKYGRLGVDTVADLIETYPELATAGAQYISGQISGDEFMREFKKSYDKVYKEREQYVYKKALEDPGLRKDYISYVTNKALESDTASQEEYSKEIQQRIRKDAENALSAYKQHMEQYMKYYDEQTKSVDTDAMRKAGLSGQEIAYALSVAKSIDEITAQAEKKIQNEIARVRYSGEQSAASFWEEMKSAYDIDLDNYADYLSAKKEIEEKVLADVSELRSVYGKFYNSEKNTLDAASMIKAGYSGQEIAYAQSLVEKLEEKKELLASVEGYYKKNVVAFSSTVQEIADKYDVDITNCRSYASAKAKIFARLLKVNKGFLSYMGDDMRELQIVNDLIDDKGNFNGIKAKTYYGLDQESMTKLLEMANVIRKINNEAEALENIDFGNIDTEFFDKLDLSDPAEQLELINSLLSEMISLYDEVFSGIKAVADERIDTLEKEKESLQNKNDEENREIELIKARQQLEDAKRNKNIRVYYEGRGFVWEADKKAIKEAEEDLKDKETDAQIAAIDKQIDALNDYTAEIDKISDSVNNEKAISAAMQHFGVTVSDKLLELSPDTLKNLQTNYRGLTLANDKAENEDNLVKYSALTDEQIRAKFGSNFGVSLDALRDYWDGTYFIPDTIKEFTATEKKAMQAVATSKQTTPASESKNYYIENININYSGDSLEEIIKEANRISKTR